MRDVNISLTGLLIATSNLKSMVHFYNTVFGANFAPITLGRAVLYEGQIGNLNITLSSAGRERARHKSGYQLSFSVSDLDKIVSRVRHAGGIQLQEVQEYESDKYCGIADPDGNTIELTQSLPVFS